MSGSRIDFQALGWIIPILVFVLAGAQFLAHPAARVDFPLDDAWIHRVYSQSFAQGKGFEYNPGCPEAGESSPLWAIVTAPVHLIPWTDIAFMVFALKLLGGMLGLLCIWEIRMLTRLLLNSRSAAFLAATLFALEPRLLFASFSGMEPILLTALWLGSTVFLLKRRYFFAVLLLSLTPLARPEALVLFFPAILAMYMLYSASPLYKKISLTLLLIAPTIIWGLYSATVTGNWLPNTFHLKAQFFPHHLETLLVLWNSLTEHGFPSLLLFLPGLLGFIIVCRRSPNSQSLMAFTLTFVGAFLYLLGVVCTRKIFPGGYYYWSRWLDPGALVLSACFCIGYGVMLADRLPSRNPEKPRPRRLRLLLLMLVPAAFFLCLPGLVKTFQDRCFHLAADARAIGLLNVKAANWLLENTPETAIIGANDAGAIRFLSRRWTIDLMGLNYGPIATGEKKRLQVLQECDWIAIFPGWFQEDEIVSTFDYVESFTIPQGEYTISPSTHQNTLAIFRRKPAH